MARPIESYRRTSESETLQQEHHKIRLSPTLLIILIITSLFLVSVWQDSSARIDAM